jgi:hypothetical protein
MNRHNAALLEREAQMLPSLADPFTPSQNAVLDIGDRLADERLGLTTLGAWRDASTFPPTQLRQYLGAAYRSLERAETPTGAARLLAQMVAAEVESRQVTMEVRAGRDFEEEGAIR